MKLNTAVTYKKYALIFTNLEGVSKCAQTRSEKENLVEEAAAYSEIHGGDVGDWLDACDQSQIG